MNIKIPPQILLLSIIAQNRDGMSINDVIDKLKAMKKNGMDIYYSFGKSIDIGIPNDILRDINILKLLELIKEENGKYIATEKAYDLLAKLKGINK
uniref:Uncharacterized protein n=1 Tax=Ignisphaera aggregans TaxID=334771 RepID=A0A7C5UTC2_9CREN